MGMAISAVHPVAFRREATIQTPSQLRLTLELFPRPWPSPSSKICCSSLAPSGLVTNMYPERESLKVSMMTWKLSSSRILSESRLISVATSSPES